jgi:hypothetical protein
MNDVSLHKVVSDLLKSSAEKEPFDEALVSLLKEFDEDSFSREIGDLLKEFPKDSQLRKKIAELLKHPLHKAVGGLLNKIAKPNLEAVLDEACDNGDAGKKQHISLFSGSKARETCLCCVDAMLLKKGKIAVVIEIEESNIKPTQICGKYLTTALSRKYDGADTEKITDIEKIDFIQILDTSKLEEGTHKIEQFKNIEDRIKSNLCGCVKNYDIIFVNKNDNDDLNSLEKKLRDILTKNGVL